MGLILLVNIATCLCIRESTNITRSEQWKESRCSVDFYDGPHDAGSLEVSSLAIFTDA